MPASSLDRKSANASPPQTLKNHVRERQKSHNNEGDRKVVYLFTGAKGDQCFLRHRHESRPQAAAHTSFPHLRSYQPMRPTTNCTRDGTAQNITHFLTDIILQQRLSPHTAPPSVIDQRSFRMPRHVSSATPTPFCSNDVDLTIV
jgi:hypothetical protein